MMIVELTGPTDHGVARGVSFRDPDGNHVSILEYGPDLLVNRRRDGRERVYIVREPDSATRKPSFDPTPSHKSFCRTDMRRL